MDSTPTTTLPSQLGRQPPLRYSDEQVAEFWRKTGSGTKDAIVAKADPCIASSRRICQRILPASRSILSLGRNSALSPLETSATCVQTIDDLERLVASYISKAESEAIAHHSNSRFSARVGRTFSTFLVNLGEYCHAYSSVIRLMEGFSHGLSSAALEILTVFVVVSDQMNPKHPDGVDMHFNNER
jgi:hypothetical protein